MIHDETAILRIGARHIHVGKEILAAGRTLICRAGGGCAENSRRMPSTPERTNFPGLRFDMNVACQVWRPRPGCSDALDGRRRDPGYFGAVLLHLRIAIQRACCEAGGDELHPRHIVGDLDGLHRHDWGWIQTIDGRLRFPRERQTRNDFRPVVNCSSFQDLEFWGWPWRRRVTSHRAAPGCKIEEGKDRGLAEGLRGRSIVVETVLIRNTSDFGKCCQEVVFVTSFRSSKKLAEVEDLPC